jgi:hypothetical protein
MTPTKSSSQHDEILKTLQLYIDGSKQGKSELMRPAFHPQASFFGYAGDQLAVGTEFLFDWIDRNGPAPGIEPRVIRHRRIDRSRSGRSRKTPLRKRLSPGNKSRPTWIGVSAQSGVGKRVKVFPFIGWGTKSTILSSPTSTRSNPGHVGVPDSGARIRSARGGKLTTSLKTTRLRPIDIWLNTTRLPAQWTATSRVLALATRN